MDLGTEVTARVLVARLGASDSLKIEGVTVGAKRWGWNMNGQGCGDQALYSPHDTRRLCLPFAVNTD